MMMLYCIALCDCTALHCRLELHEKYMGFTLEGLKYFMRCNKQPIAGTKVRVGRGGSQSSPVRE
jgi:hypothetical protein